MDSNQGAAGWKAQTKPRRPIQSMFSTECRFDATSLRQCRRRRKIVFFVKIFIFIALSSQ